MKVCVAVAAVLVFAVSACYEERDPAMSRIDSPSVIVLNDGREIECPEVKEAERGWECWRTYEQIEDAGDPHNPDSWYAKEIVSEVRRAGSSNGAPDQRGKR